MASGAATSPADKGRWVSAPEEEGLLLGAICTWPVKTRTADTCRQCWAEGQGAPGMRGEARARGRGGWHVPASSTSPPSFYPVSPPRPPLHGDRSPLPPSLPGTRGEMAGSLGVRMPTESHTGHGSGHWYTEDRRQALRKARTCLGLLAMPDEWQERALEGTGAGAGDGVRSTSRHTRPGSPRSTGRGGSSPHV